MQILIESISKELGKNTFAKYFSWSNKNEFFQKIPTLDISQKLKAKVQCLYLK